MAEARVRRRRLRLASVVVTSGIALVALFGWIVPELARREVERRLSALLPGVVTIGSLGIGWRDASLDVDAIDLWASDAPAAPLLRVARLSLRVELAALGRREFHVREAVAVDPELHVERLADGRFSVGDLAPEPAAPLAPAAASAERTRPWTFRIDAVRVMGGRVRFRDFTVGGSEALAVEIERIAMDGLSLVEGPLPAPASLAVEARVAGAPLRLAVDASSLLPRLAFAATLEVAGLRLAGATLVGGAAGLERLHGSIDATLHHVFETGVTSVVDGTLTLHDVAVGEPRADDGPPGLGFARLDAVLERVDLRAHVARLGRVAIAGATARVTPGEDVLLPALAARRPEQPVLPDDVTAPPPSPWTWTVSELAVPHARLRMEAKGAERLDVTASLAAKDVGPALAKPFPLTLEASVAGGRLTLAGHARIAPTGFQGTLRTDGLELARVLAAAEAKTAPLAARVRGARLASDLALELPADAGAGSAAPEWSARGTLSLSAVSRPQAPRDAPASLTVGFASADLAVNELRLTSPLVPSERRGDGRMRARGTLRLTGAEGVIAPQPRAPGLVVRGSDIALALESLELPDPITSPSPGPVTAKGRLGITGFAVSDYASQRDPELGIAWRRLDADLEELRFAVPPAEPGDEPAGLRLERMHASGLRLDGPWLHLTRTQAGLSLPPALAGGTGAGAPAELVAAAVSVANGSARFVDQTVSPYYDADFGAIHLDAQRLRSTGPTLEGVRLEATSGRDATIRIVGGGDANGLTFVANASGVALPPFNPYATTFGYDIGSGIASAVSSVWIGPTGIEAKNWLTLQQLAVGELVPGSFEKRTGVSLGFALDVLTDRSGTLALTLPVWWNAQGFGVHFDETLRAAARQAIVGTLALPLTRLGAWIGGKDEPRIEPPPPIGFAPGSAELSPAAEAQVREVARFLASRPGIAIALEAKLALVDGTEAAARRALAELRMERVARRLADGYGVPAKQVTTRPAGDTAEPGAGEVRLLLQHL